MDTEFMRGFLEKAYEYPGIEKILEEKNSDIIQWRDYRCRLEERIKKKYKIELSRDIQDMWDEINGRLLYLYIEEAYLLGAQDRELMLR